MDNISLGSIIKVLDILASIGTVVSIFLVIKSYKWWILYTFASLCFIAVCIYNRIPGLTIMGICLFLIGIKNYITGYLKDKKEKQLKLDIEDQRPEWVDN